MNEIVLAGCAPVPLASYLKALGIMRLLSRKDSNTRGRWHGNQFRISSSLSEDEIRNFLLWEYCPTPIVAPWNKESGFYGKNEKKTPALISIEQSSNSRLEPYRKCIEVVEKQLDELKIGRESGPEKADKKPLLARLRSNLPDDALDWFDATISLTDRNAQYPPLLGGGGVDARSEFSKNFMGHIVRVVCPNDEKRLPRDSEVRLSTSLFSTVAPCLILGTMGQFVPGQVEAYNNSDDGLKIAKGIVNPWDFVLLIEGSLAFAAATTRRHADDPEGVLSYPFTVQAVGAGSGSLGESDQSNAHRELWLPVWSQPTTYAETRSLLAEGRVALGRKPTTDALDFVRAIHHLGGYRGISSFQRFGLLNRSGQGHLATPLSRVHVDKHPRSRLLNDLDESNWLERFRRFSREKKEKVPARFLSLRKQLEDKVFEFSARDPKPQEVQAFLVLLGKIQLALSTSKKAMKEVNPVPRLSKQWIIAADDRMPHFRIAKSLAGLKGPGKDEALPLRSHIFPVNRTSNTWVQPETKKKKLSETKKQFRCQVNYQGRLVDILGTILERRLMLMDKLELKDRPLTSPAGAQLTDVAGFLRDDGMDQKIKSLLPGLALCRIPKDLDHKSQGGELSAAFGLLKLATTPNRTLRAIDVLPDDLELPLTKGLVAQLRSGNPGNIAVTNSWRRLRASGLSPACPSNSIPELGSIDPVRVAAALLIPMKLGAIGTLARKNLTSNDLVV